MDDDGESDYYSYPSTAQVIVQYRCGKALSAVELVDGTMGCILQMGELIELV